jgi:hypothetical protein
MWCVLYFMVGAGFASICPMQDETDCKFVDAQIVRIFDPKKHGCVKLPNPPAVQMPAPDNRHH